MVFMYTTFVMHFFLCLLPFTQLAAAAVDQHIQNGMDRLAYAIAASLMQTLACNHKWNGNVSCYLLAPLFLLRVSRSVCIVIAVENGLFLTGVRKSIRKSFDETIEKYYLDY